MTVSIYLAHLNPVTNAHVEIIEELKKESDVIVMPVIFRKNNQEVNSRSFPFSFEIRKQMLDSAFGNSIKVSKNYTFRAPFWRYLPPLLSPFSWILRKQILEGISEDYFTYTGDKAEGRMLKGYRLNPKIGIRKTVSATSVKNKMYDTVLGKNITWEEDVPQKVIEIIKQHWKVVEKYAKLEDETTRVVGMKFPKDGYWSR
ncbi:nicotinamide-nucleotide adenylyltransferase [archaeon MnTg01]|nr:nicotinamide-nucleotide adenylyltransferase [archaeon MnTg01]